MDSIVDVVQYVLGKPPKCFNDSNDPNNDSNNNNDDERYKASWTSRFKRFNTGKDVLWSRMDYKTIVNYEQCLKELSYFPNEPEWFYVNKYRTVTDLDLIYDTLDNTE